MSKIRTLNDLQDALDQDLSWRLKEISIFSSNEKKVENLKDKAMLRAGVAILYSHWEGFIKNAATNYINYVNSHGLQYDELENCFVFLGIRNHINSFNQTKDAKYGSELIVFIRDKLNSKSQINYQKAVDTESNLSSIVFSKIAHSINLPISEYESKFNLIDKDLLKRRNEISHGEYLELNYSQWSDLAKGVILMMRQFKTDIENAASTKAFRLMKN